jgi:hypothetical protein
LIEKVELKIVNPATEEIVDQHKIMTKEQINDKEPDLL